MARQAYICIPKHDNYAERQYKMRTPYPTKRLDVPEDNDIIYVFTLKDSKPEKEGGKTVYYYKFKRTMAHPPGADL